MAYNMFSPPRPGGIFSGFADNADSLIMTGMGLMGGRNPQQQWAGAMQGYGAGSQMDQRRREKAEKDKLAADQKAALEAVMADPSGPGAGLPPSIGQLFGIDHDLARRHITEWLTPKPAQQGTDDMREYEQAVTQGFPGSFLDYQIKMREAGRAQTTINTGDFKIPPSYKLKDENDPSAGVEPIPGGPGEQMPAELAARIGMADSFLGQAPAIKQELLAGEATGLWDRAQAGLNSSSDQASVLRKMKSGTDALQRMLTGAGMPISEAAQYAERYLPTYTDNAVSAAEKLDQLTRELQSMKEMAMRGRGESGPPGPAEDGSIDMGDGITVRPLD